MADRDIDPTTLSAVVISHEHTDHVGGAGVVCRRFGIPLYITEATRTGSIKKLGKTKTMDIQTMECGTRFTIGSMEIHPFSISHDAADTSGFRVTTGGSILGIATDLGGRASGQGTSFGVHRLGLGVQSRPRTPLCQ